MKILNLIQGRAGQGCWDAAASGAPGQKGPLGPETSMFEND